MCYQVIPFDNSLKQFLPRPQHPFPVIGRLIPRYDGEQWRLSQELLSSPRVKTYPDDVFDPLDYVNNPDRAAFLAFQGDLCIGSIRLSRRWNQMAWIEDLAVDPPHRGRNVGTMLMDAALSWSRERGLNGVSLETQDWNLLACRFYLRYGFQLGGIDRLLYAAGPYREETALYFYLLPDRNL